MRNGVIRLHPINKQPYNNYKITFTIMVLEFTAKTVSLLEKSLGMNIGQIVQAQGVTNAVACIQTGLGCTTNDAFAAYEEFTKTSDLEKLWYVIMKALQDKGFLSRELPLDKIQETSGSFYQNLSKALENNDLSEVKKVTESQKQPVEQAQQ